MISDLWYKNAVIYCLSVATFMDANGDGVGDFAGLMRRLDYLQGLGITAIWLMPFRRPPSAGPGQRSGACSCATFGPDKSMQLYGRGIRRRLAPMLGGDRRRIELAYSLMFTLPGTPVLRYGDETWARRPAR
jgi:glycosidase